MVCCEQLSAGYGLREILHRVSLRADAGEHVAVLGPNGSGKTTLLRVLDGTLTAAEGTVALDGHALGGMPPRERARRVAVVPQRLEGLPALPVRDMVLLGRYPYLGWWGVYGPEDRRAADDALRMARALPLAERSVAELSGGEVQRVLLARALAQQSRVLLLDELAAGLDLAAAVALFDMLDARRRAGMCLITVMHDLNLAALYATRLVGIRAGCVLFDGPVREVFTGENLSELYGTRIHVRPHPWRAVPQMCLDRGDADGNAGLPTGGELCGNAMKKEKAAHMPDA